MPPEGFQTCAPGTVLRSREVKLAFLGLVPQAVRAYQLLYRTTDFNGSAQTTLTTIIRPRGAHADPAGPVLSYQCAIDALASSAFPSYVLRRRAKTFGGCTPFEYLLIACALSKGWTVLVPDHEGARGSWGVPREPGYCVLDGIRAAKSFDPAGIGHAAPVALWGYSGGGLATSWAAELWKSYAPELNVVGAVLGSPVADPGEVFHDLNGTVFAGEPALVLASLAREYPDLKRIVHTHVNARGQAVLERLQHATLFGALIRYSFRDFGRYLDRPVDEIFAMPEVVEMIDDLRLGSQAPAMPLLIVQAVHDPIIDVRHIDALVDNYTRHGAQVTYLRDRLSEHAVLHPLSTPTALQWVSDRFDDKPVETPTTSNTMLVFSARALIGLLWMGWVTLRVMFGRSLPGRRQRRDAKRFKRRAGQPRSYPSARPAERDSSPRHW
ncbi:lipase family protein [Mycobacterium asiaticum]|uniref:lipase family protein n=1 Tax=Mycobacterium asiaticum TaxID=1790 RepID=UPI001561888A|nr:lipase family protein [Mycobacterium asiaticum]